MAISLGISRHNTAGDALLPSPFHLTSFHFETTSGTDDLILGKPCGSHSHGTAINNKTKVTIA